jgi:predicted Zn-dependent peptidase
MIHDNQISQDYFKNERKIVYNEIIDAELERKYDAEGLADRKFYKDTDYEHEILGTKKSLGKLSLNDIWEYRNIHYTPDNMVIGYSGAVTPEVADEMIEKYWLRDTTLRNFKNKAQDTPVMLNPEKKYESVNENDMQSYEAALCFPVFGDNGGLDDIEKLRIVLLANVMNFKLYNSVRLDMGLVYSIRTELTQTRIGGYIGSAFSTEKRNIKKCFLTIGKENKKLSLGKITADEVEVAKNSIIGDYYRLSEDQDEMAERAVERVNTNNRVESIDNIIAQIDKVKRGDIIKAAKTYATSDNVTTIAVIGPNAKKLDPFEDLTK